MMRSYAESHPLARSIVPLGNTAVLLQGDPDDWDDPRELFRARSPTQGAGQGRLQWNRPSPPRPANKKEAERSKDLQVLVPSGSSGEVMHAPISPQYSPFSTLSLAARAAATAAAKAIRPAPPKPMQQPTAILPQGPAFPTLPTYIFRTLNDSLSQAASNLNKLAYSAWSSEATASWQGAKQLMEGSSAEPRKSRWGLQALSSSSSSTTPSSSSAVMHSKRPPAGGSGLKDIHSLLATKYGSEVADIIRPQQGSDDNAAAAAHTERRQQQGQQQEASQQEAQQQQQQQLQQALTPAMLHEEMPVEPLHMELGSGNQGLSGSKRDGAAAGVTGGEQPPQAKQGRLADDPAAPAGAYLVSSPSDASSATTMEYYPHSESEGTADMGGMDRAESQGLDGMESQGLVSPRSSGSDHLAAACRALLEDLHSQEWSQGDLLVNAAARGDVEICEIFAEQVDPLGQLDVHARALVQAAHNGHADVVQMLLERQAGWHVEDLTNEALIAAAKAGHTDVCRVLLSDAQHPAQADAQHSLALREAARVGNLELCELLLSQEHNPARQGHAHGSRALREAANAGHVEVCRMLLQRECASESHVGYVRVNTCIHELLQQESKGVAAGGAAPGGGKKLPTKEVMDLLRQYVQ